MKKLIASLLVLGLIMTPCFATLTPTYTGKMQTSRGMVMWGTFTGLGTSGAGSTTLTVVGINKITNLATFAASVISTSGAVSIKNVVKNVITVSQECSTGTIANPSSGYWMILGR